MIGTAIGLAAGISGRLALRKLHAAGFRTFILERGTICAYKGTSSYGFQPKDRGFYNLEAIERAIAQEK